MGQNEIKVRGFKVLFDYVDTKDEAIIYERIRANDSRFSGNVEEPTSNIMVRGIPSDIDERDVELLVFAFNQYLDNRGT